MMKQLTILVLLSVSVFMAKAQIFEKEKYPQGYFRNPLNIPISLSGNMGELRPNHYHMGFDFKTDKRENLPVYAAADGYIAHIKIEPTGFGRAIYINHPNGYTTVYCHLNDFNPALEKWVKEQQYKMESWRVFLDVPTNLFVVKKGDYLANSGNTGGSEAPHLHFEIRKTESETNLNPMLFGFPLQDNTQPNILRLALYNRNKSTYEQSPQMVTVKKAGNEFVTSPSTIITSASKISLAITSYDTHTSSTNLNGIFEADLVEGGKPIIGFQMNNIAYDATRYMNAHIDYKTKAGGGPFLQHLSELPGYIHSIYKKINGDGVMDISDGNPHTIKIIVKDGYGNTSVLSTAVQYKATVGSMQPAPGKMFYPLMLDVFESAQCEFFMGEKCLYDSVHIAYKMMDAAKPGIVSNIHSIGAAYIPLQDSMMVRIKPTRSLSAAEQQRTIMHRFAGSKQSVLKVDWQKGWATARFRDFGNFELVVDNEPPQILPVGFTDGSNVAAAKRLMITIKDNYESFKNFRATLDGKWLRFSNDKGKTFIYNFDENFPAGEHELRISVEDEAGNVAVKNFKLKR